MGLGMKALPVWDEFQVAVVSKLAVRIVYLIRALMLDTTI